MLTAACTFLTSSCFLSFAGVLLAFAASLYFYLTRNFGKWEKKYGIKGLKPVPFFGTEKDLLMGKVSVNDYVLERYKEFDGHKFGIMYQGSRPTVYVRDYELLKNICIRDFDHFTDFFQDGLDSIVDSNLFFMNGDKWKHSKGALAQVFRMKNVKDILPKLNFCIKRSMAQLDTYAKTGEVVRMDDNVLEPCLLDCVGHAVCGVNIDAARDTSSEFTQMVYLLQSSVWRFILLTVAPEFMKLLRIKVFYPKAADYLDRLLRELIIEHKRTKKHDDMMGVLLKVKGEVDKKLADPKSAESEDLPLTEDMIISSVMQFFFDGVITIASMLSIAVFYLAQNPDIQEKAYEEIQSVLGDRMTTPDGGDNLEDLPDITDADLMEMKYVEQIFEEAQRIAAFPFIFRTCTKDYKMPDSDFIVPKGTPVHIPILGFHMDPKLFPNPEKFDPDRFSPENKGNIATGTFIPFGQGPRMCLGKNYIRIEGRCYLANLIRSFRILPSDKTVKELTWDIEGQGKVKGGLWVHVERRD